MRQIRYLRELKNIGPGRGCVGAVADLCGVNHGTVSRFFRACCDNGYLTEELCFTEAGEVWLDSYLKLQEELRRYLCQIGVAVGDIEEDLRALIENISYSTLSAMLRSEEGRQGNRSRRKKEPAAKSMVSEIIEYGSHEIYFVLLKPDLQNGYAPSMANRGFRNPATLRHSRRGSYLELEICEMEENSRVDGRKMTGRLESLKYEKEGVLQSAVKRQGKIRIPLEVCRLTKRRGGEMRGEVNVMVTCSAGRVHMPESTALLVFWL